MKSKALFWILAVLVFGFLFAIGFLFFRDQKNLFWLCEGVAALAFVFFTVLYFRLIKPYRILLNGVELMKEQDFSTRLRPVRNPEANRLIDLFNRMMGQLKNERLEVREKNRFLDLLIQASPQGVVILDFDERITEVNPAGLKLLGIQRLEDVLGKKLEETGLQLSAVLGSLDSGGDMIVRGEGLTVYRCARSSFVDRGFDHPFLLIEEVTHEMLKMEKSAYENIIRMMSHEVNNSVGAIGSTLNVVSDILNQTNEPEEVILAVEASYDRCGKLARFISNLADVVRIPEPGLSDISINMLIRTVESLTRLECQRREISLEIQPLVNDRIVRVDGIQFEHVLVNLIKNAYESIGRGGKIRIIALADPLTIVIEDNGPGVPENVRQKLFTPFFTTKPQGQGLGLMFVREVLINHGMAFRFGTKNGSTRFEIFL